MKKSPLSSSERVNRQNMIFYDILQCVAINRLNAKYDFNRVWFVLLPEQLLGMKWMIKHQDLQMSGFKFK